MHIVVSHHCKDDATRIIIAVGDVVILPLEVFYRLLVQVVDIIERSLPRFPGIEVSVPSRLSSEMGSAKGSPDLSWGLPFLRLLILLSRPLVVDVVLQVPATDELLYLIF